MPTRTRPDDQTDYEDPIDRYRPRENSPKAKKKKSKNGAANSAYVMGLISLVPFIGAVLGPVAIFIGLSGLSFARTHRDAGGKEKAKSGIWFGIVACLVNFAVPAIVLIIARLWR